MSVEFKNQNSKIESKSIIADKAYNFALQIISVYKELKKEN